MKKHKVIKSRFSHERLPMADDHPLYSRWLGLEYAISTQATGRFEEEQLAKADKIMEGLMLAIMRRKGLR